MDWPVRYKDLLIIGNKKSNVGIVCHWTLKEKIAKGLDKNTFTACGQLYSRDLGISSIIRNVLAHPYLDTLVLCGNEGAIEETKSSKALLNLLKKGVDENHCIKGEGATAKIESEIPIDKINLFRSRLKTENLLKINDSKKIQKAVNANFRQNPKKHETFVFPELEKTENIEFASESAGFIIRRNKVAECWPDILKNIIEFGKIKGTQYGEKQKEIIDLMAIVEDEDIKNPYLPKYFNLTKKQINNYVPILTTAKKVRGTKYTYGQRLRDYKGIDQIQDVIDLISKAPFSRRGVATTWNVEIDREFENPPCLDLFQALVQGNKLSLTVYIRSNDMLFGWPENAFGILALQNLIIKEINNKNSQLKLEKGPIITISASAHIYESNWEKAKNVLKKNPQLQCAWDPRGNFIINVEKDLIKVYNSADPFNLNWEGKTSREILDKMIFYVSQTSHAGYLGRELMKAEMALKSNLKYIQDHSL